MPASVQSPRVKSSAVVMAWGEREKAASIEFAMG